MSSFRTFIIGFFLSYCYSTFAGVPGEIEFNKASVDYLYNLAWDSYEDGYYDSAHYYANIQQTIARKISYIYGIVNSHYIKSILYVRSSHFDLSAKEAYEGLALIGNNADSIFLRKRALLFQCLGISHEKTQSFDHALTFSKESLALFKKLDLLANEAILLYNIGVIYEVKRDFDSSLYYYEASLDLNKSLDNDHQIAIVSNSIGNVYNKLAEYQSAKEYYSVALEISNEVKTLVKERTFYISNLGENAFKQEDFVVARYYYSQALAHSEKLNDTEKIKWLLNNLGDVSLKEGNYSEAIAYYQRSIALGDGKKIDEEMKRAYKQLAEAYKKKGRYKDAWIYNDKFVAQMTSLQETKYTLIGQNAEHKIKEVERERQLSEEIAKTTRRKLMSATLALGFSLLVLLYVLKSGKAD